MDSGITLSVVVIGRNEGYRLINCLDSIHQISYPENARELIYVDSISTDDSVLHAKAKGAKVIEIENSQPTAALARNMGWKAAGGKYVLFLDADTILDPDFIARAIPEFKNPQIGVVSGVMRERHPNASIFNRVFDLDWNIASRNYCGGNALVRRDGLEKVRGYNPKLIAGEEPEMCQRLQLEGYIVKHIDVPMATHDLNLRTFRQYWTRCFRSGYAYASIDTLWKKESRHNLLKGGLMIGWLIGSMLFLPLSFYPLALYLLVHVILILRTTLQKLKKHPLTTALLYGIHAHFQHIPMFFGQLAFWMNKNRQLIEYK